ncbi:MAG: hypothetical protein GF381_02800 [Candidatus Pacebacteria bacterium]|nr:hypothetical protein [Candidatus Paceibacterota bacterium]
MMNRFNKKKSLGQKQIPTLLGLLILIGALASGVIFFGRGTGVFAPRATPQTTPKQIRTTNLTDDSLTITFYTDEATPAFVKYGTEPDKLNSQASDDRDQLSGSVEEYKLHHITLRNLNPATTYYYVLGTGSRSEFSNDGQPFSITTGAKIDSPPPNAKTVYGSVSTQAGNPAEGSIVYLSAPEVGDMSSLVKGSGSWAVPLAKARTTDGNSYAQLSEEDQFDIFVQGPTINSTTKYSTTVAEAQPVEELVLGSNKPVQTFAKDDQASDSADLADQGQEISLVDQVEDQGEAEDQEQVVSSESASMKNELEELLKESAALNSTGSTTLNLAETTTTAKITTSKPIIKGQAKPNVEVKIEVHSDNQIESTVTADENGDFELDLAALSEGLEPGEHTVTYSYTDPETGQEVVRTETFIVESSDTLALAETGGGDNYQALTPTSTPTPTKTPTSTPTPTPTTAVPYGSGNPYSISPTASASPMASASPTLASSTRSAVVSTNSALTKAGTTETTLALMIGGLFFVLTGAWSWWLAGEIDRVS